MLRTFKRIYEADVTCPNECHVYVINFLIKLERIAREECLSSAHSGVKLLSPRST
jgi:hypothetical protein